MTNSRPWLRFYGKVPASLDYPEVTLYEALAATARRVPGAIAWEFFGKQSDYRTLLAERHGNGKAHIPQTDHGQLRLLLQQAVIQIAHPSSGKCVR